MCQQFLHDEGIDAMDGPTCSPDLNPIEHIWDIMSRSIHQRHVAPQTVQEFTDALIQVWEEIPQENIRRASSGACQGIERRSCRHVEATHTNEPHFDLSWGISTEVGSACNVIFHFYSEYDSRSIYIDHFYAILFSTSSTI